MVVKKMKNKTKLKLTMFTTIFNIFCTIVAITRNEPKAIMFFGGTAILFALVSWHIHKETKKEQFEKADTIKNG